MKYLPIQEFRGRFQVHYRAALSPQNITIGFLGPAVQSPDALAFALSTLPLANIGLGADDRLPPTGQAELLTAPPMPWKGANLQWVFRASGVSHRLLVAQLAVLASVLPAATEIYVRGDFDSSDAPLFTDRDLASFQEEDLVRAHVPPPFQWSRVDEDDALSVRLTFAAEPTLEQQITLREWVMLFMAFATMFYTDNKRKEHRAGPFFAWAGKEATFRVKRYRHDSDLSQAAMMNMLSRYSADVCAIDAVAYLG